MTDQNNKTTTLEDVLKDLASPNIKPPQPPMASQQKPVSTEPSPSQPISRPVAPSPNNQVPSPQIANNAIKNDQNKSVQANNPVQIPNSSSTGQYSPSIRTMAGDLEMLRKGEQPSGTELEKRVLVVGRNQTIEPTISENVSPNKVEGSDSNNEPEATQRKPRFFGLFGQASSMGRGGSSPAGNSSPTLRDGVNPEGPRGIGVGSLRIPKKWFFIILGGLVGLGLAMTLPSLVKDQEITIITPTPRPSKTPKVEEGLASILGNISSFDIQVSASGSMDIASTHNKIQSEGVALNQFRIAKFKVLETKKDLNLSQVLDNFESSYSSDVNKYIASDSAFLVYGQKEIFASQSVANSKRIVLISEITDLANMAESLKEWEPSMINDLLNVLVLSKDKASSKAFLGNTYKDISIRYINFALPDVSLDYAIIPAKNKKNYIVITNSRESIYSIIDRIK